MFCSSGAFCFIIKVSWLPKCRPVGAFLFGKVTGFVINVLLLWSNWLSFYKLFLLIFSLSEAIFLLIIEAHRADILVIGRNNNGNKAPSGRHLV